MIKILKQQEISDVQQITKKQIIELLKAQGKIQQNLFKKAREVRKTNNLEQVKLRGFIDIAPEKGDREKYCLNSEEIIAIARQIRTARLDTVVLELKQDIECNSILEEVIPTITNKLNLNIVLSLGERNKELYKKYVELGIKNFALDFGTSNPILALNILEVSLKKRLRSLNFLQQLDLNIETGNIIGLPGQNLENIAEDILLALEIKPAVIQCIPYINPHVNPLDINLILNTIAIYRLALPQSLITSVNTLEKLQPDGKLMGLNAGANLLDINFTPTKFGKQYTIYSHHRFMISLEHVCNTLERAGLKSA